MSPAGGVRHLAVLGSPIEHSRSPELHRAAYRVLGLPWEYERVETPSGTLPAFFGGLDESWRGLSLTMPLKHEVLPLLAHRSDLVDISGAANTVLFDEDGPHGFNTDVAGLVGALGDHGVTDVDTVHIIGTGNTAGSAFLAAARLGASRVLVSGRSLSGIHALEELGDRLGVHTEWRLYGSHVPVRADLVINTLPGDIDPDDVPEADLGDVLMEVPYDPWPTPRAARWTERDGLVVSGLEMLLHQAIEQVRIFATGVEGGELDDEDEVVAAMREAVRLNLED
ncbi:shikimate dehydrogenase family protein [Pseudolysinimonas sp.]|uniref:shikimate dehydrogenase family protein n=1 Tax=Pseudolysinimonas sp. TaxID=2680009 RepID=UPI003782FBCE